MIVTRNKIPSVSSRPKKMSTCQKRPAHSASYSLISDFARDKLVGGCMDSTFINLGLRWSTEEEGADINMINNVFLLKLIYIYYIFIILLYYYYILYTC
eukprot:GHVR01011618.1.p1 GENE.GHVR01011618.1~~GHVR01011618.1.p1  ORF type:complete len:111 (+),score=1.77 GHVR01011618.1:39-335(+)